MWLRCFDCAKEEWDPKDWHMDVYHVRKRDLVLDTNRKPHCPTCKCESNKWGHPSGKIFLCDPCYHKHHWMA